jgi:hypothetical protein
MEITQYNNLATYPPNASDLLLIVDVNDYTMSPAGSTKTITYSQFMQQDQNSYYVNANANGYAVQNWDVNTAYTTVSPATLKTYAWLAGYVWMNRIPVPYALSGLTGDLCFAWRKGTGTGTANAYIGVYSYSAGTLTQQYVSGNMASTATGNPNSLSVPYLTSIAADTPATALYVAVLIGTQDSAGAGPACVANGLFTAGIQGGMAANNVSAFGPPMMMYFGSGSSTSLAASYTYTSANWNSGFAQSWWAVY